LTLREIGEKYDISRERVRQIEERVKRKLKAFLSKELKDVRSPRTGTG
jgi:RNA polymerase sigma-32 factor